MAETDLYGIDVRLTDGGDLAVSASGGLIASEGPANVAQALVLRLRCWPGELPLHLDYGSQLERALIGAKEDVDLAVAIAARELQGAFEDDSRYLAAKNLTAATDITRPGVMAIATKLQLAEGDTLDVTDLAAASLDNVTIGDPLTLSDEDLAAGDSSTAIDDDIDLDENPDIEDFLGDDLILETGDEG